MKRNIVFCTFVVLLVGYVIAQTPQDEENVRGAFLTTRPKEKPAQQATSARPVRRRPRPSGGSQTGSKNLNSNSSGSGTSGGKNGGPTNVATQRLGLGLTLFTRDSNGLAVRVDPSREFHKGEAVRVLLETNVDGYLYIFNTTDNGSPIMIYPSPEIDEAGNYLQSHVPFEIPSSVASEERLRWFRFDENAGTERLYFVFTRERLPGVPIEDDLMNLCRQSKSACPWRPSQEMWAQLQKESSAPLKTAKSPKYGRTQTTSEHVATTRGLGLSQQDPEPTLIMMATGPSSKGLITTLDLIHK